MNLNKYIALLILNTLFSNCSKDTNMSPSSNNSSTTSTGGVSGSLANMIQVGNFLYLIKSDLLDIFDISNPNNLTLVKSIKYTNANFETVYYTLEHPEKLFLGTPNGMWILDITNKSNPGNYSIYQHVLGCDPVVVKGNYAYVTVRSGTACRNTLNIDALETIDISNFYSPRQISSYSLTSPYGLGVDGNNLFVCEGGNGVARFNINSISNPTKIGSNMTSINAFDVILKNGTAMFIGSNGLNQYSYNSSFDFTFLSTIPIVN